MRVRVTEIESARSYKDGQRRITIRLEGLTAFYKNELELPESVLGLGPVELDEEFTVILSRAPRPQVVSPPDCCDRPTVRDLAGTDRRPTAEEVAEKLAYTPEAHNAAVAENRTRAERLRLDEIDPNTRVPWREA